MFNSFERLWFDPNGVGCGKAPNDRPDFQFDQTFVEPSNWKHTTYTTPKDGPGFRLSSFHRGRDFRESNPITDFHRPECALRIR